MRFLGSDVEDLVELCRRFDDPAMQIPEHLLDLPKTATPTSGAGYTGRVASGTSHGGAQHVAADRITVGRTPTKPTSVATLAAGDRVKHMLFGEGEILSVQKMGSDYLYEIAFDTKGTKKLMATYAKLQKI